MFCDCVCATQCRPFPDVQFVHKNSPNVDRSVHCVAHIAHHWIEGNKHPQFVAIRIQQKIKMEMKLYEKTGQKWVIWNEMLLLWRALLLLRFTRLLLLAYSWPHPHSEYTSLWHFYLFIFIFGWIRIRAQTSSSAVRAARIGYRSVTVDELGGIIQRKWEVSDHSSLFCLFASNKKCGKCGWMWIRESVLYRRKTQLIDRFRFDEEFNAFVSVTIQTNCYGIFVICARMRRKNKNKLLRRETWSVPFPLLAIVYTRHNE